MDIKPTTHGKLSYLIHAHNPHQKWEASPGNIEDIHIDPSEILIDVEIDREDACRHESWDPIEERVMVEIHDQDEQVIYEHPVEISKAHRSVTLGLRET